MSRVFRASWYHFRATFRQEWGSYLTIGLLLGLLGGLALGSLAAARRTQSSYSALVDSTNPAQIDVTTAIANPSIGNGQGYDPAIVRELARLPHVTAVASAPGINAEPLGPKGAPIANAAYPVQGGTSQGSIGGEYFRMDRLAIVAGRAADPTRADEFVTSPALAAAFGFRVGEIVPMGFYTNSQTGSPRFGTPAVQPYRRLDMRLVGVGLPVTEIVADDVDAGGALAYFTPALTSQLLSCCVNYTNTALQVGNSRQVAGVEADITRASPGGLPPGFEATAGQTAGKADRAIKPLSIALGVFGGTTALAALVIAAQVIGRYLRRRRRESEVLRALGAEPPALAADALVGVVGAIALGSLLAVLIAVALSPLSPLGPVRPFYPTPGVSFDWTVLGGGFGALFVGLSAAAMVLVTRHSPQRVARRQRFAANSRTLLRSDGLLGLPVPAATGLRFALGPGNEVDTVPMRSAIVGAALAVTVLIGTITFAASLDHLVSTPRLYGWNWSYALSGGDGGGGGDIPAQQATTLLERDRYLSAWSSAYFSNLIIDGQDIPVIGTTPGARVQPPILDGHGLLQSDEIVVGALTLASLHKHLGDTVTVSEAGGSAHSLRIVGLATMPTIGGSGQLHLEMGSGAVIDSSLIPPLLRNPFDDPETGPNAYFVDVRPGVNPMAALRSLEEMTGPLSNSYNFGVVVQAVLHPAEIVDYRSMGTTPAILGASLGAGALAALGLTLLASVRRRRRDLAVLKTLGLTRSQLGAVVAWQSNVAVAIGTLVGIPVGIALGRTMWDLFADEINAVPSPAVPVVPITLIGLGAIVLANVVAAIPGRIAARTPVALLLRAE
ncbi:MAG TPA: FtsX-like permease family protein [Acidimicrobiales bacterium]|nr:FtsX-like permease family protein [Acidimicrobiales bacterium]